MTLVRLTRDLLSRTPSVKGEILKQIRFKRKVFLTKWAIYSCPVFKYICHDACAADRRFAVTVGLSKGGCSQPQQLPQLRSKRQPGRSEMQIQIQTQIQIQIILQIQIQIQKVLWHWGLITNLAELQLKMLYIRRFTFFQMSNTCWNLSLLDFNNFHDIGSALRVWCCNSFEDTGL